MYPPPSQFAADFKSILSGQHDVEQNQVEMSRARTSGRRLSISNNFNFVPFQFKIILEAYSNRNVVFDDKNMGHQSLPIGR